MQDVAIRYQQVSDARYFWRILNHPEFYYFPVKPKTIKEERAFLRLNREKRRENLEYNFTILYQGEPVGGIGVAIDQRRPYIGECGYFVDRKHWGLGIATEALRLIEGFIIDSELPLHRLELIIITPNTASVRVAEKCGYQKEGLLRGRQFNVGVFVDVYFYAKLVEHIR